MPAKTDCANVIAEHVIVEMSPYALQDFGFGWVFFTVALSKDFWEEHLKKYFPQDHLKLIKKLDQEKSTRRTKNFSPRNKRDKKNYRGVFKEAFFTLGVSFIKNARDKIKKKDFSFFEGKEYHLSDRYFMCKLLDIKEDVDANNNSALNTQLKIFYKQNKLLKIAVCNVEVLKSLLKLYDEKDRLEVLINNDIPYQALRNPESLKYLLSLYPYELLRQRNRDGENALMCAFKYHPESVPPIFDSIVRLELEQLYALLKQANSDGYNALMLALEYHRKSVPFILAAILTLEQEHRYNLLKQRSLSGWSALMIAARDYPELLAPILDVIATLEPWQQYELLKEANADGENAFMCAFKYYPESVPLILDTIVRFEREQRYELLKQTSSSGWSVLMIAARDDPGSLTLLFDAIATLEPEEQYELLKQTNGEGENVLMIALKYAKQSVAPILNAVARLPQFQRDNILKPIFHDSESKYNHLLRPEDWFNVVEKQLLPYDITRSKKAVVCEYICNVTNSEKKLGLLTNALDKETSLGEFFYARNGFSDTCCFCACGFFGLNERADILKKLSCEYDKTLEESLISSGSKIPDNPFSMSIVR